MIVGAIVRLGDGIGPSTVAGLIAATVVDSIDAQAGRAWPHVIDEGLEGAAPFIAHENAFGSVVFESAPRGRVASAFGFLPDSIFTALGSTVCSTTIAGSFCTQAATASGFSADDPWSESYHYGAAFAAAIPSDAGMESSFMGCPTENRQASEFHPGFEPMHNSQFITGRV